MFYAHQGEEWLEFQALYADGQLLELDRTQRDAESQEPSHLRFDPGTVGRLIAYAQTDARKECRSVLLRRADQAKQDGKHEIAFELLSAAGEIVV